MARYPSDSFNKIHNAEPVPENEKATAEGGDIGFHEGNLYDLNEGAGGRVYDEALGPEHVIDNSTYTGRESLSVVDVNRRRGTYDVLGPLPKSKEDREADAWMERRLKELGHIAQT